MENEKENTAEKNTLNEAEDAADNSKSPKFRKLLSVISDYGFLPSLLLSGVVYNFTGLFSLMPIPFILYIISVIIISIPHGFLFFVIQILYDIKLLLIVVEAAMVSIGDVKWIIIIAGLIVLTELIKRKTNKCYVNHIAEQVSDSLYIHKRR